MYVDLFRTKNPQQNPALCVYSIYRLMADQTYRVDHPPLRCGNQIFVYTDLGHGELHCAEGTFELTVGSVLLFSGDTPFSYRTAGEQWNFWWFEFSGEISVPKGTLYSPQWEEWAGKLCRQALKSLQKEDSPAAASILSCLVTLAASSLHHTDIDARQQLFLRIQSYIEENLFRVNVSALAQIFHVEPRTLYNLFQRFAGCSPKAYLQKRVLENVRYLLANTTKTIAELADETGFSNPFHLSRAFKESYGLSPNAYRQQLREIFARSAFK